MKKRISSLLLMLSIAGQSARAMEADITKRVAEIATQTGNFVDMGTQTNGNGIMTVVIPVVIDLNPDDASDSLSNGWYPIEDTGGCEDETMIVPKKNNVMVFVQELAGIDVSTPKGVAQLCRRVLANPRVNKVAKDMMRAVAKSAKRLTVPKSGAITVVTSGSAYAGKCVKYVLPIVTGPTGKIVAVVVVVVMTYKLYNKYFKPAYKPAVALSLADLWVPIKGNLQLYMDEMQDHMFLNTLESITYDLTEIDELREKLSASLYEVDDEILTDMKKVRDTLNKKLVSGIATAMRKTLPADEYYRGLDGTYEENLLANQVDTFGVVYNKVYEFLGVTREEGMAMDIHEVARLIDAKVDALRAEGRTEEDLYRLRRQFDYMFRSATQKEEYDAFVGGKLEVAKVANSVPEGHCDLLERKMQEVADILVALDELIEEAEADGWVAIDAR